MNYDDDPFSGLPLATVYINNDYYIVPYFTQNQIYDGEVQFETNGGWGKILEGDDEESNYKYRREGKENFNYLETVPYVDIIQNCEELTNIAPLDVDKRTIYYVIATSDITNYCETIPDNLSHYFKVINPLATSNFENWKNIPMKFKIGDQYYDADVLYDEDRSGYADKCDDYTLSEGIEYEDYQEAKYYDEIVLDTLGNNPHTGNGKYDLGQQYYNYLEKPFKYALDNHTFTDMGIESAVQTLKFAVTDIAAQWPTATKIVTRINEDSTTVSTIAAQEVDSEELTYYLPSKVLIIKNKHKDSKLFIDYFFKVINKYLMQVIPSTTILVYQGFRYPVELEFPILSWENPETAGYETISTTVKGEPFTNGETVQAGSSVKMKAVDVQEGYNIQEWINLPDGAQYNQDKTEVNFTMPTSSVYNVTYNIEEPGTVYYLNSNDDYKTAEEILSKKLVNNGNRLLIEIKKDQNPLHYVYILPPPENKYSATGTYIVEEEQSVQQLIYKDEYVQEQEPNTIRKMSLTPETFEFKGKTYRNIFKAQIEDKSEWTLNNIYVELNLEVSETNDDTTD